MTNRIDTVAGHWNPSISEARYRQIERLIQLLDAAKGRAPLSGERRQSERYPTKFPVLMEWRDDHDTVYRITGICRNISCGGMSIISRRYFYRSQPLIVHLPQSESSSPRVLEANVRHCNYLGSMCYEIGIQFIQSD